MDYERKENFVISASINSNLLKDELLEWVKSFTDGDIEGNVVITQNFDILYLGVVQMLQRFLDLYEAGGIVRITTNELNYQKCLVQEVLCKLNQIEEKIK